MLMAADVVIELPGAPGVGLPMMIIADSAYKPQMCLLPAFTDPEVAFDERGRTLFNKKHALTRNAIERAFGVLKGRWRVLLVKTELDVVNLVYVIGACCILHNMCQKHRCPEGPTDDELRQLVDAYNEKYPNSGQLDEGDVADVVSSRADLSQNAGTSVPACTDGAAIRNAFVSYLKHVYELD